MWLIEILMRYSAVPQMPPVLATTPCNERRFSLEGAVKHYLSQRVRRYFFQSSCNRQVIWVSCIVDYIALYKTGKMVDWIPEEHIARINNHWFEDRLAVPHLELKRRDRLHFEWMLIFHTISLSLTCSTIWRWPGYLTGFNSLCSSYGFD